IGCGGRTTCMGPRLPEGTQASKRIRRNNSTAHVGAQIKAENNMPEDNNLQARREMLLSSLRYGLQSQLSERHEKEIAKLIDVLADFDRPGCEDLIGAAEVAGKSLLLDPPNLSLASEIRSNLEARVKRFRNPLLGVMRGGSPPSLVIFGLGMLLY